MYLAGMNVRNMSYKYFVQACTVSIVYLQRVKLVLQLFHLSSVTGQGSLGGIKVYDEFSITTHNVYTVNAFTCM